MEEQMTKEEQFNAIIRNDVEITGFAVKGIAMCMDKDVFKQSEQMALHDIFDRCGKGVNVRIDKLNRTTDAGGVILKGKDKIIERLYQKAKNNHMAAEKFLKGLEDLYRKRMDEFANADEIGLLFEHSNYEA